MKKASQYFSGEHKKAIEEAIARAEQQTSGEIVPVVASVSGRYDRAEDIFGLLFAMLVLSTVWIMTQQVVPAEGQWLDEVKTAITLPWALLAMLLGFIAGATVATFFPALRLPFVAKQEMQEEVERSAAEAFHRFRIRGTQASTGVLIYVSLYERQVRVIGDAAISEKLAQSQWDEVCSLVVAGMKSGEPAKGLEDAIAQCGSLLAEHFPTQADDQNELPNTLHLID
jgi:putative membrane protein